MILIAAAVVAVALVVSALIVQKGLVTLSKAFGWTEDTAYVDLDKMLAERAKASDDDFDPFGQHELILETELPFQS